MTTIKPSDIEVEAPLSPPKDREFTKQLKKILEKAERLRLRQMEKLRMRRFVFLCVTLLCVSAGGGGFAWFFLVENNLDRAFFLMLCAFTVPLPFMGWVDGPRKKYLKDYKAKAMPAIAKALGNMRFHPERGIGRKYLEHSGILPPFTKYSAEDCFTGRYKGTKIILSEARLTGTQDKSQLVFDGLLALIEAPNSPFQGHTIVSSDLDTQQRLAPWHTIPTTLDTLFKILTNAPQDTEGAQYDKLLVELEETSKLFDNAPINAALFGEKFILIAIPCAQDLFEPSNVFVPISTHQDAMRCKKEIEKILSIIDVLDIYKN